MNNTVASDDVDELWHYGVWIAVGLGFMSVCCVFTTVCSFIQKIVGGQHEIYRIVYRNRCDVVDCHDINVINSSSRATREHSNANLSG